MEANNRTLIVVGVIVIIIVIIVAVAIILGQGGTTNTNPPPAGAEVRIVSSLYSFSFSPSSVTIHLGENVTWINDAGVDHTIVSDNATDPFNSGLLASGHSYTHEFNRIGVFPYHCSIHTYMTGTITVIA